MLLIVILTYTDIKSLILKVSENFRPAVYVIVVKNLSN